MRREAHPPPLCLAPLDQVAAKLLHDAKHLTIRRGSDGMRRHPRDLSLDIGGLCAEAFENHNQRLRQGEVQEPNLPVQIALTA